MSATDGGIMWVRVSSSSRLEDPGASRMPHSVPRTLKSSMIMSTVSRVIGVGDILERAQVGMGCGQSREGDTCREAYSGAER